MSETIFNFLGLLFVVMGCYAFNKVIGIPHDTSMIGIIVAASWWASRNGVKG